jgi:hypothetical protein
MSIYDRLSDFDKEVKAKDKEIYDWQFAKYSPLGLANTKPTSEAIVHDLNFYRAWKEFVDKWNKDNSKLVDTLDNAFPTKDPYIDAIDTIINKRKEELTVLYARFSIIKSGKKDPLQDEPEPAESPWGTILVIGAVSAGVIWLISKVSK